MAVDSLFSSFLFLFFFPRRAVVAKDAANLRQSHDFTGSQNDPRGSLGGERGRDGVSSVQQRGGEREGDLFNVDWIVKVQNEENESPGRRSRVRAPRRALTHQTGARR